MTVQTVKNNWIKIVLALISAGFIGQLIGVWDLSVKRQDTYIDKYIDCKDEIIDINRKLNDVRNRLNTIELASTDIPFPYWIKDVNSTILFINKEYKRRILTPLKVNDYDFIGTKGELLGVPFMETIEQHDNEVLRNLKKMEFIETVPGIGDGTSYKYPLFGNSGYVIGTAGIWIPDKAFKK